MPSSPTSQSSSCCQHLLLLLLLLLLPLLWSPVEYTNKDPAVTAHP